MHSKSTRIGRLSAAFLALLFTPFIGHASLSGSYTIDGSSSASSSNYKTFAAAISDMTSGTRSDGGTANGSGVSGKVTFTVASGSYNEQLSLGSITGASASNTITFIGKTSDSSKVVVYYTAGSTNDWVLNLTTAQWVTFKSMTFKRTGTTTTGGNTVIYLSGSSATSAPHNNKFLNCQFIGHFQASTSSLGFYVGSGSCVWSTGNDTNNLFQNNRFANGYNGYFSYGSATTTYNYGNKIIDNIFDSAGCSAIYSRSPVRLEIRGNTINLAPFPSSAGQYVSYGMRLEYAQYYRILKNKVYGLSEASVSRGIVLFYGTANTSSSHGVIANNFVWVSGGSTSSSGIANADDYYQDIYYNTVLMTSTLSTGAAYYKYLNYTGSNQEVVNNNFIHKGGGFAVDIQGAGLSTMDYNNLYTSGSYIANDLSGKYSSLSAWQSASSLDANSISLDPGFVSNKDLHVTASGLDGKGISYSYVTDDIDGQTRNSSTPDIGADEFTPPQRDAGISVLDSPAYFCSGTRGVYVKFGNFGVNALTSLKINWSVNGTAQSTYSWSGTLASGATSSSVKLGTFAFSSNTKYAVKIWTSSPNGSTDQDTRNDTLLKNVYTGMSGSFTIGGTSPDFKGLNEAVSALSGRGVCGATTFKIRSGTYPEQLTLNPIPGASFSNTITFQSEAADSSKVIIETASTTATGVNNAVIQFNGADYITFKQVTISRTGSNLYAMVIEIKGGAHNNRLLNNAIKAPTASSASTNFDAIYSGGDKDTGNWIKNNYITYGYRAIDLLSATGVQENGWEIDGNIISGPYNNAITIYNSDGLKIRQNKIGNTGTAGAAYGIYLSGCNGSLNISGNVVNAVYSSPAAMYLVDSKAPSSGRGLISNNMFSIGSTASTQYAMMLGDVQNLDIYFNTFHCYSNSSGSSVYCSAGASAALNFKNNIYSNNAGGSAFYLSTGSAVTSSDYNNFDVTGGTLAVWNSTSYSSLSALKSGSSKDANSVATKTFYASNTELHNITPGINGKGTAITGITTDIDGQTRGTPPDIGADEFTLPKDNAGVISLASASSVCVGSNSIKVKIKNYGTATLTKVTVNWSVNDTTKTAVSWTGSLATDSSAIVTLGSYTFTKDIKLKAWTTNPNGNKDEFIYDDSFTTNIKGVQLPAADAGKSQHLCIGSGVTIGAPAVLGSTYSWTSSPSGFTSTDPAPTVAPTSTTSYTLKETNSTGCVNTHTIKITVDQIPKPDIGKDTVEACEGKPITLGTKAVAGSSYFWSGPPGFNESTASFKLTPTTTGYVTYTVRETVDSSGCWKEDKVVVHTNAIPSTNASSDRTVCAGSQITLGSAGTAGNTYSWRSIPTGFTSSVDKPVLTATATTTYILTETTKAGCSKTDSVIITVKQAPAANVGSPKSICEGDKAQIGAVAVTGSTYAWTSSPAGFTSTKPNPIVTPKVTTKYYMVETSASSGCSKKDSVVVTVNPKPIVSITGPTSVCQGRQYVYKSPSISTSFFTWDVSGGSFTSFSSPDSISVNFNASIAEVSLIVMTDEGCSDTFALKVTANPSPKAGFTSNSACLGAKTFFTNTSTGGTTYQWAFGDGGSATNNSPSYTYAKAGIYKVSLLVKNASGCYDTISHTVTVQDLPKSGWSALQVSKGTYNFAAKDTTKTAYTWTFGDGGTANKAKASHTYTSNGSYAVKLVVRDANSCESETDSTINVSLGIKEPDPFYGTLSVYPNPFGSSLTIEYALQKNADVQIRLTDIAGRTVSENGTRLRSAGKHKDNMAISNSLKPGVYMLGITTGGVTVTKRVMKVE